MSTWQDRVGLFAHAGPEGTGFPTDNRGRERAGSFLRGPSSITLLFAQTAASYLHAGSVTADTLGVTV